MTTRRGAPIMLLLGLLAASACTGPSDTSDDDDQSSATTDQQTDTSESAPSTTSTTVESFVVDESGASGYSNLSPDYLGNPIWATGPGNIPVAADNSVAIRFTARHTGAISRVAFILKYDFERTGYHGGTCGELHLSITGDAGGVPADDELGSITLADPCAGPRDIGNLVDLAFDAPVAVSGGAVYHLVFANNDSDPANYFSVNMLYRPDDTGVPVSLSTGDGTLAVQARGDSFWSGNEDGAWGVSDVTADHYPAFELTYDDDTRQGVSYVGARVDQEVLLAADNPTGFRQQFTPTQDRTITKLWFRGLSATPDAAVAAALTTADGARFWAGTLSLSPGDTWLSAELAQPLSLTADQPYAIELFGTAGQVEVRPLYQAQHDDWTSNDASDWSRTALDVGTVGAWAPYQELIPHDLSVFFETAEPETAPTDPVRIMVYGDSLLSEPIVEDTFAAAANARDLELVGVDAESGRTTPQLVELVQTSPTPADVYVIDIGINGGETAATFEDDVRATVAALKAVSPDATIVWTNLFALAIQYDYIVTDRVEPRNEVLDRLDAEGLIDVVDWASTAAANPDIYGSDGVHFFGREDVYLDTVIAALDQRL